MKGLFKSRKAISPILATLLLIVIAVAAIVVTYAWIMTYMGSQTNQAGVFLRQDNVVFNPTSIQVYVRNTGTADATIDIVYLGTSISNMPPQTNVTYNPTNGVVAHEGGLNTVTIYYSWTQGTTYHFKIVPKLGTPLEFMATAAP